MTIAENLNRIIDAKEAIKEAIVSKGGQVTEGARIDQYPAAIEALPSGGDDTLDKIFDQTVEEIHNTTPIKYGRYLFAKQSKLKIADIVLSDNINSEYQYAYMFSGCSSLTEAQDLPATTLVTGCYAYMFQGCSSLTEAPELPAETLNNYCYQSMFSGCSSLTTAPALPATKLGGYCYQYMFLDCKSLTKAPALPATTLTSYCYTSMFSGCKALTTAPELPATTLSTQCYTNMFQNCTKLQKTGRIAASGSISSTAGNMFQGCTSLKEMTWTATTPPTINANIWTNCPTDMIIYVPDASVDAYKAASVWTSRASYIKPISERPTE